MRAVLAGVRRNPTMTVGLAMLAVLLLFTAVPGLIAPHDPIDIDLVARLQGPSSAHLFGTDDFGRDIFSRVVYGARISLAIGTAVVAVAFAVGGLLGVVAGWYGGWVDETLMRLTDVFFAFPPILLPMLLVVALRPGLLNTTIALAAVWWPAYARLMRGQVLAIKHREFLESAISLGGTTPWLIRKHVVPNALAPVVVMATMDVGFAILASAGLGFLGLGAQPPRAEWGAMTSDGLPYLLDAWWYPIFPGLAIAFAVLAFNLIGDELQRTLDTTPVPLDRLRLGLRRRARSLRATEVAGAARTPGG